MRYPAPMSPEDIIRVTVLTVTNTGVSVYHFCSPGEHAVNYNSSFLPRVDETMDSIDTMHVWRMGSIEVRKLILDIQYPNSFAPGSGIV